MEHQEKMLIWVGENILGKRFKGEDIIRYPESKTIQVSIKDIIRGPKLFKIYLTAQTTPHNLLMRMVNYEYHKGWDAGRKDLKEELNSYDIKTQNLLKI